MTREERRAKIDDIISSAEPVATGTKLVYQGETKLFDVYKIPLEFLVYNVQNGRISSLVKSYQKSHQDISEEDSRVIEKFLYDSNTDRNDKTEEDIAKNGQMEPGIITRDGVIIDGNRRACLLNAIHRDVKNKYDQNQRDRSAYFLTRVLPEDAQLKEILKLETTFQMGSDSKVDYNPIEKYLHAKDLFDHGFSYAEIAEYMGLDNKNQVKELLDTLNLMDEYLDTYDYEGIYTQLPKGCEDDFLKLLSSDKKVTSGQIPWIQSSDVDEQETNLKSICFDYIRLRLKQGFDYRAIAYTKNSNFLVDEPTWREFVDKHFSTVDSVQEQSTEDTLSTAENDEDMEFLLKRREETWQEQVKNLMEENYSYAKDRIENKKDKAKPLTLITKAINALNDIELSSLDDDKNMSAFRSKLEELQEKVDRLKEITI